MLHICNLAYVLSFRLFISAIVNLLRLQIRTYAQIYICARTISIFAFAFLLFDDFDDSARTESGRAELNEFFCVLD